jgi:hypothetical protein
VIDLFNPRLLDDSKNRIFSNFVLKVQNFVEVFVLYVEHFVGQKFEDVRRALGGGQGPDVVLVVVVENVGSKSCQVIR